MFVLKVRMGKGKGGFDHWGCFGTAGKVIFEISAPDMRVELAKRALLAAGTAIPGPVQFINRATLEVPAVVGLSRSPRMHAGRKFEEPINTSRKVRALEAPIAIPSVQIGHQKLEKHYRIA